MLGCTLFVDKTSTLVPVELLQLVYKLDEIHTYAWGVVVLAYLYRKLGLTSQGWVYEHFHGIVREAHLSTSYVLILPRVSRWDVKLEQGLNLEHVQRFRRALNNAQSNQVCALLLIILVKLL
ncbi:hypothetical protein Sjap_014913 [Stephania japonica]|uniref:Aminotransferase-like plant mobile domain-containing protein n=1 Tax=Stephania japonica TaxID=461633 RepID=A0AAP0IJM9_9MAGN